MDSPRNAQLAARLFGSSPESKLALMRAAWPVVVGPELARRTEVVAFDRGVLRVGVADATWQRGLARMRGEILGRLRRIAGTVAPRSLGFVQGHVPPPAPVAPSAPSPGPVAAPPAVVVAAAASIPDAELRERFLAAAGRYFGRFPTGSTTDGSSGT